MYEPLAPRVVARAGGRLHDGLGPGHVERHFVVAGERLQPFHVVEDHRVIGAKEGAQLASAPGRAVDALLVEVQADDADAGDADLQALLGAWGSSDPDWDFNADGIVDGADLGLMLVYWGICP